MRGGRVWSDRRDEGREGVEVGGADRGIEGGMEVAEGWTVRQCWRESECE